MVENLSTNIQQSEFEIKNIHSQKDKPIEISFKLVGEKFLVTLIVGGKIIASGALLLQSVDKALFHFNFSELSSLSISTISAYCNAVVNFTTRAPSINNQINLLLTSKQRKAISQCKKLLEEMGITYFDDELTSNQKIYTSIVGILSRLSLANIGLNTFNATIIGINKLFHLPNHLSWKNALPSAIVSMLGMFSYRSFAIPKLEKNAKDFAEAMMTPNWEETWNKLDNRVFYSIIVAGIISAISNMGTNFFSTEIGLINFFELFTKPEDIKKSAIKIFSFISLIWGTSTNLHTGIAELFRFIKNYYDETPEAKEQKRIQWESYINPLTFAILPNITFDIAANTFGTFISMVSMLGNFIGGPWLYVFAAIFTVVNLPIYTVFNGKDAMDKVSKIEYFIPEEYKKHKKISTAAQVDDPENPLCLDKDFTEKTPLYINSESYSSRITSNNPRIDENTHSQISNTSEKPLIRAESQSTNSEMCKPPISKQPQSPIIKIWGESLVARENKKNHPTVSFWKKPTTTNTKTTQKPQSPISKLWGESLVSKENKKNQPSASFWSYPPMKKTYRRPQSQSRHLSNPPLKDKNKKPETSIADQCRSSHMATSTINCNF